MSDLAGASMAAVYARLAASVTGAQVFTLPPEGTLPPVVVVAEIVVENQGSKDLDFEKHTVRIVVQVAGGSRAALFALQAQVKTALHRQPLTSPTATLSAPEIGHVDELLAPDGATMIGQQHFALFAQPNT